MSEDPAVNYDKLLFPMPQDWYGPPCPTCGYDFNCEACQNEAAYNEWLDKRVAEKGVELAMAPDRMECYECGRNPLWLLVPKRIHYGPQWVQMGHGLRFIWQPVVAIGPVVEAHRDPTQTYKLKCGHLAF